MPGGIVPFEGPAHAQIMFVGEAPGRTDIKYGKPFAGGAGRILDQRLREAGIHRERCRFGNVMREWPSGNNFQYFYKHKADALKEGIAYLKADILKTKPNIVVVMGNEALKALTGHTRILKWRGSLLWSSELKCKILATVHPEHVMKQWSASPLLLLDLKKAKREGATPDFKQMKRHFAVFPTFDQVMHELDRMQRAKKEVSFDLETTRGDVWMTTIAIADRPDWAICIPFMKGEEQYWTIEEEVAIMKRLKVFMECESVPKIAQNAQFDMGVLAWRYGINVKPLQMDTMAAFHTLYSELPKSLDTLTTIYTDHPYYAYLSSGGVAEFYRYNCIDAAVTYECAQCLKKELADENLTEFYYTYVNPLIKPLLDMQLRGISFDVNERDKARENYEAEYQALHDRLQRIVGHEINPLSTKQLAAFLYDELALPEKFSRKTHNRTVDEKALDSLSKKYPSPIFEMVLRLRDIRKTVGTYLDAPLAVEDGRLHTSFNIGGAITKKGDTKSAPKTGRLSSSFSIVCNSGGNMQNQPKKVRNLFVPDKGLWIGESDLSQAEARVVAWDAEEEVLIDMFNKGRDIHRFVASIIFDKAEASISREERQFAKRHVHAFNYGETPEGFAYQTGYPAAKSLEVYNRYFNAFPKLSERKLMVESGLARSRIIKTPTGRVRRFFGRGGDPLLRDAYAFTAQSVVADLLNLSLIKLDKLFRKEKDFALLLQIHDSTVFQYPPAKLELLKEMIREAYDTTIYIKGRPLTIPVELEIGLDWANLKEVPLGPEV